MRNTFFSTTYKRVSALFFALLLLVSLSVSTFPERTNAQFGGVVFDFLTELETTLNITQLAVLNPVAWAVAKSLLQSVVKSTISSINKNSNGTPSYGTNLASTLKSVGDTQANSFLSQLQTNGSIKSPFQTAVASYTKNSYLQSTGNSGFFSQNAYTLAKVSPNPTMAYNGGIFTQQGGGMSAFMNAWSYQANNPLGAATLAQGALGSQVAAAQDQVKTEASWGQGYLSQRPASSVTTTGGSSSKTTASNPLSLSSLATDLTKSIQTPGSTLKSSLDKAAGSGIDTLVNAHTFTEVITSILSQLINQVVGSGGLAGTSQPSTASASTYFNQTDPSQATINSNLTNSFSTTISNQIIGVLQFQQNWTTINSAALAANTALSSTTCYPNAQATITNIVQPVLTQASSALAQASGAVVALRNIQNTLPSPNSTTDQTAAISAASTAYTSLLSSTSSPSLPTATALAYAQAQSQDTGSSTSSPPSLYTQMRQLTTAVQKCSP